MCFQCPVYILYPSVFFGVYIIPGCFYKTFKKYEHFTHICLSSGHMQFYLQGLTSHNIPAPVREPLMFPRLWCQGSMVPVRTLIVHTHLKLKTVYLDALCALFMLPFKWLWPLSECLQLISLCLRLRIMVKRTLIIKHSPLMRARPFGVLPDTLSAMSKT